MPQISNKQKISFPWLRIIFRNFMRVDVISFEKLKLGVVPCFRKCGSFPPLQLCFEESNFSENGFVYERLMKDGVLVNECHLNPLYDGALSRSL
jgi:hypothetical protein